MRSIARKTMIVTGLVVLGAAAWFGLVYGFVCGFAGSVETE